MSQQATLDDRAFEHNAQTHAPEVKEEVMPLPKWLMRIYYIFPIILYVPDVIFNYFVYSKGVSTPFNVSDVTTYPENALWLFLALGIVGMAWLLSILAPWHWVRNNKFQSVMCWVGVLIATAITTWNSLAYRMSQTNSPFPTDKWVADTFHITLAGFSPTTILVSISPPFWGLFWAIVQPAERRRSAHEEQQSHEARMLKITLDAEMKAAKANANATVREAQLKGLAASMKAARSQIGSAVATATNNEDNNSAVAEQDESAMPSERVVALPNGSIRRLSERRNWNDETTESGEHEILRGAAASMSFSVATQSRDDVFQAPEGDINYRSAQGSQSNERGPSTFEGETLLGTSRPGMPRASTLLRNYADGEHVMRTIDGDVETMRNRGMKITIKTFAEFKGIELTQSKQLLAKWREWKQNQGVDQREAVEQR